MADRCDDLAQLWSAWVDGGLDHDESRRAQAHLRRCRACRDEVTSLRRVRDLLRNLPLRRLPAEVRIVPPPPAASPPPRGPSPRSGGQRAAAALAMALGLVGGAAFALGGQPATDQQLVRVPVDLYVADHLVHTVGGPVSAPVVVDGRP